MSLTGLCHGCRRSISFLLCRRIQPPDGTVLSSLKRAVVWLVVVAFLCAQPTRLCIAARPLHATKDARIVSDSADAPRTTQLDYYADALLPHVAERRYPALRVSPTLHPPKRPAPLDASLLRRASQDALPKRPGERRYLTPLGRI